MFVLVTQADGSARRIPFLTIALAGFLLFAWGSFGVAGSGAMSQAAEAREEVLAFFESHPYIEVSGPALFVIEPEYATSLQEAYFQERADMGLPELSEFVVEDAQENFELLVAESVAADRKLPEWRLGVGGGASPAANYFMHIGIQEAQVALVLALVLLVLTGMPLEDGWGHLLFGAFVLASIAGTAAVSRAVGYSAQLGLPWIGASGLIASLLGAYFVRSLRGGARLVGAIPMPGWMLLPIWVSIEYLAVRQVGSGEPFQGVTAMVHAAGFGFGAVTSTVLWSVGFERKMIDRVAETPELVSNPLLERAMKAREKGEHEQAFELLQNEFARTPNNHDLAVAYWDVAMTLGQPEQAAAAVVLVIRNDLKAGNGDQAVRNWFALSDSGAAFELEPPVSVRLAEVLLDEGHPDETIRVLERAISGKQALPTAMAQRVVRIARDLDPDLTSRAAAAALADPKLGPSERDELIRLSDEVQAQAPSAAAAPRPAAAQAPSRPAATAPPLAPPVAEPVAAEPAPEAAPTSPPPADPPAESPVMDELGVRNDLAVNADAVSDFDGPGLELDSDEPAPSSWDDGDVSDLDPGALSLDALEEDFSAGSGAAEAESASPTDVVPELSTTIDEDFGDDLAGIDPSDIEAAAIEEGLLDDLPDLDQPLPGEGPRSDRPGQDTTITEVDLSVAGEDTATEVDTQPCISNPQIAAASAARGLRVRTASPLSVDDRGLRLDVDGSGKTRLGFGRIGGLAVAAVKGLSEKPVLLVDLVLNPDAVGESLKVIRMHSDAFDPRSLVSGASSPLDALRTMLSEILRRSGACPMPSADAVTGSPFVVFDDLETYQRDVLGASDRVA